VFQFDGVKTRSSELVYVEPLIETTTWSVGFAPESKR